MSSVFRRYEGTFLGLLKEINQGINGAYLLDFSRMGF